MDTSQYLEMFIDETREHLQNLNEQLLVLEKEPENEDTINEIFRAAHSIKGMAGTMGYKRMQRLTHDMENVFQEVRSGNMKVQPKLVDILFQGLDALEEYLNNIIEGSDEGTNDNNEILQGLQEVLDEGLGKKPVAQESAQPAVTEQAAKPADKRKYLQLSLADYEKKAIEEAMAEGKKVYGITVYLQETCLLKAARAFLVFKGIEKMGELVKSLPSVEDIEDERFEFDFSWIFVSTEELETIKHAVGNVSEIEEVVIEPYDVTKAQSPAITQPPSAATQQNSQEGGQEEKKKAPQKSTKVVANRSVRVDIEKLDVLMNLVSELIIAKNGLISTGTQNGIMAQNQSFTEQIEYLERVTTNLHESVMKVRMVPIESVVNRFPRMIRDLCKKLDKKMELYMTGEETELDRTVIDEIGDPLMHLLRNSADHGLEKNEDRIRAGKPEVGEIHLDAYQDGNNVVIEVGDDGAGINVEKIKKKALEKGTITQEQAETMEDKEVIDLLFRPSFSTAEKITDVSGRGVGLDVVKNKIETLGGSVEAHTELGKGSKFTIRLPLTLAIINALMIEVADEKYAIPLGNIQTIETIDASEIRHIQSREVINLRGSVLPVIRLRDVLDVPGEASEQEEMNLVVVKKGDKQAGLVIDQLLGQQEIVIKSIGSYIYNSKMIGGATILGDGEVALILEINGLL